MLVEGRFLPSNSRGRRDSLKALTREIKLCASNPYTGVTAFRTSWFGHLAMLLGQHAAGRHFAIADWILFFQSFTTSPSPSSLLQSHRSKATFSTFLNVQPRSQQRFPFTMKLETLKDLYVQELKDLYSAETQIIKALPKMVRASTNKQLARGFQAHLAQTKEHATRLEKILKGHDQSTRGPKCKGMEGFLKEGAEMIEEDAEDEVRDAGLISAAQRVEHYEMAGYGCARTYAELLGDRQGAQLLQTTLTEESDTDKKLSKLAESVINVAAE